VEGTCLSYSIVFLTFLLHYCCIRICPWLYLHKRHFVSYCLINSFVCLMVFNTTIAYLKHKDPPTPHPSPPPWPTYLPKFSRRALDKISTYCLIQIWVYWTIIFIYINILVDFAELVTRWLVFINMWIFTATQWYTILSYFVIQVWVCLFCDNCADPIRL
jgi:hypothetical protein